MTKKITHNEYIQALKHYDWNYHELKFLRMGQFLINTFWQKCEIESDPEIFYEKDEKIAKQKFREKYVEK
jgi:hypothetical protein